MRRAITLAEVLVSFAVFSVVLAALVTAFGGGARTVTRGMEMLDALTRTALALEYLRHDLRGLAGPLPQAVARPGSGWMLELLRLDSVDAASGRGRYLPVRWELARERERTVLTRAVEGDVLAFPFDGAVTVTIAPDLDAPDRAISVRFALPGRPAIAASFLRQDPRASVRLVGGVPRIPRGRLLPEPDAPFPLRPDRLISPVLYPPDVKPLNP